MEVSIIDRVRKRQPAVVKANSLIEAKYKMSTREQKVLLFLISKLSPEKKSEHIYETHVDEIMQVLKDSGIKWGDAYSCFTDIIMLLKSKPISIHTAGELTIANWLGTVSLVEKSGVVKYTFDSLITPFLFEIKKNFTQYPLRYVIRLRSTYSIRVYELLKQYLKIGERRISLSDLRELLGIEDELYPRFYDFKKRVLLPAQKELEKHTDLSFEFKEIKVKRTVTGIIFYIYRKEETPSQQLELHKSSQATLGQNKAGATVDAETLEKEERLKERLHELELDNWQIERIMDRVGVKPETGVWKLINAIKMDKRDGRIKDSLGGYTARQFEKNYNLGFFK
ncbi:replication initiation protein (plasmid) [Flammeovirgaceae bacterium SG7u.111]|nr:replication initiation protein [Flammeovirgaceae bacterium SG7u.132]WPO38814.1 replication initiation protein [Flammeovirgaceae bacterium SG7u.111]